MEFGPFSSSVRAAITSSIDLAHHFNTLFNDKIDGLSKSAQRKCGSINRNSRSKIATFPQNRDCYPKCVRQIDFRLNSRSLNSAKKRRGNLFNRSNTFICSKIAHYNHLYSKNQAAVARKSAPKLELLRENRRISLLKSSYNFFEIL